MWIACDEMEELGWISSHRPRMVSVQADGYAPIVEAFMEGSEEAEPWAVAVTLDGGQRVPVAIGSRLMLSALRDSDGITVAISDNQIRESQAILASSQGIFPCLEGAATIGAVLSLNDQDWLTPDKSILVFNTGTGLKHRLMLT